MRIVLRISLMAAAYLGSVVAPDSRVIANPAQQSKDAVLSRIKASSGVQIYADNSQGSPLYIKEAIVKEVSSDDYTALVGESSRYFKQTTFPDVTLLNISPRTIKAFSIAVESNANKQGYVIISPKTLSIAPNTTYNVSITQWTRPEKVYVQRGEKFVNVWQRPGLDSTRSWIPGASSDLRIVVCMVEFEDGTRWKIPADTRK